MGNEKLKTELVRKGLHFLIALVPFIASINECLAIILLYVGTILYIILETLRLHGVNIPFISSITQIASRPRDKGRFVLGPVTLALGAVVSLVFFPHRAAEIAVFALAFGDGASGIFGRAFGTMRPRFLLGKSVEGCFSCFTAVFIATALISGDAFTSCVAALTAMCVEALPLRDWDNLAFPIAVGLAMVL
jgi:dolichol kinase